MADFGVSEGVAAWDAWEAFAAAQAAAEASAAAEAAGAGAGAAAGGLFGSGALSGAAGASGGLTAADTALASQFAEGAGGLYGAAAEGAPSAGMISSAYGPAAELMGPQISESMLGPGGGAEGLGANGEGGMLDELKAKGIKALNKVGGAYNKLPGPVQSMVASQLMPHGQQAPVSAAPAPHGQPMPAMPSQPTSQMQPYAAKPFGSSYGPSQDDAGISPQLLALLKKLKAQQGGLYA